jgi:catechol-2,3-dioxygenase
MNKSARPRRVKGLGEVSIRVKDLDAMHKFYEEVVGLEVAAHRGLCQAG